MSTVTIPEHPHNPSLRMDRMPHIWCPGCGVGTGLNCLFTALEKSKLDPDKVVIVSGIGCSGRIAGYANYDSFHTTHGRAIPFATGVKLANPELTVIVFCGDGDLFAIGGNHMIHAARRNVDINVFCINNFIYGMTGGQAGPTTPLGAKASTSPYGCFEDTFNLPQLVEAAGATYVARWALPRTKQITKAMREAIAKRGFSFLEMLGPCPTVFSRYNRMGSGADMVRFYKENSRIENGASTKDVALHMDEKFVLGKFVDVERPTFLDRQQAQGAENGK